MTSAGDSASGAGSPAADAAAPTLPSGEEDAPPLARRRRGGLYWHRDFRLLWAGESVSMLGDAMGSVAMPLVAVSVLHATTFAVASLTAATYVPYLVLGLPAGAFVDRLPSGAVMIGADVASLGLFASIPLAAALGVLTIGQLVAVAALAGACGMMFGGSYNIYLRDLVEADDLIEGNAKLEGSGAVTRVAGPGLGGLAAQALGPAPSLLFDAGSFVVSAACLLRIGRRRTRREPPPARQTTIRQEVREGIRFVAHDRYLRPLMVWAALANVGLAGYFGLIVVFLVRSVGLAPGVVGVVLAAGGAGGVGGALATRPLTERFGTARTLVVNCTLTGALGLLTPLAEKGPRLALCVLGILFIETGLVVGTVILGAFRQSYCPPALLGRISTSMRVVTYGTAPPAALIAGALGDLLGPREALLIMLAVVTGAAVLLLASPFARDRDLPVRIPDAG